MSKVVISQPMIFPWIGIFEQFNLCDVFIHLDDVQLPQGKNFITRVEIKTLNGIKYITIPVKRNGRKKINEITIDDSTKWREKILKLLQHEYARAPYFNDMYSIASEVLNSKIQNLSELNMLSIELCAKYLDINKKVFVSSNYNFSTVSSMHLIDLILAVNGNEYITGHGAKNYLDHNLFVEKKIEVYYMDYQKKSYSQLNDDFYPYISILDPIANLGKKTSEILVSQTKHWKEFLHERA